MFRPTIRPPGSQGRDRTRKNSGQEHKWPLAGRVWTLSGLYFVGPRDAPQSKHGSSFVAVIQFTKSSGKDGVSDTLLYRLGSARPPPTSELKRLLESLIDSSN